MNCPKCGCESDLENSEHRFVILDIVKYFCLKCKKEYYNEMPKM